MARSEAPQDPRPYVRIATDLPLNPKLAELDNPAAGWAYVVSICYAGSSFTDGHIPLAVVARLAGVDMASAMALAEVGLWHLPGHDCVKCPQPKQGSAYIHDYLQHQRSAEEVKDLTSKRREAGRKGAEMRWSKVEQESPPKVPKGTNGHTPPMASAMASAIANGQQDLWQNDGKTMAEERRGEEKRLKNSSSPRRGDGTPPPGFAEFWLAYPRKVGKQAAQKAYAKAIKNGTTPERLLAGAQSYAADGNRRRAEPQFTAHPSTWLNDGRWDDEPEPAVAPAQRTPEPAYYRPLKPSRASA